MAHLNIVKEHAKIDSDIRDHIEKIYLETLQFNPKLIVELGVRYGESTRIFNFVNNEINSRLISVDVVPYINFDYTNIYNGTFYLIDDIKAFSPEWLPPSASQRGHSGASRSRASTALARF